MPSGGSDGIPVKRGSNLFLTACVIDLAVSLSYLGIVSHNLLKAKTVRCDRSIRFDIKKPCDLGQPKP